MVQKYCQQFIHFFKSHTGSEWQQSLASMGILGTAATFLLLAVCLAGALLLGDSAFARITLPYFAVAAVVTSELYWVDRRRLITFAGTLLIVIYVTLGLALMCRVGVGAGAAILLSAAVILTSAFYGFWFALAPTVLSTIALVWFRFSELRGSVRPEYVYVPQPSNFDTVIAIALLLHVLAVACGVVHHYLLQANQRLQASEEERLQQLYRFAEIGEISTALIHDLANTLSSLGLEVESIQSQTDNKSIARVRKKIKHLNSALGTARAQLRGRHSRETFDIAREITQTVASLQIVAKKARVTLDWMPPSLPVPYIGEKVLLQQVLAILLKNAIDSYASVRKSPQRERRVRVSLTEDKDAVLLSVVDQGMGIKPDKRSHIFEPFYSTKKDGMGMGLYLTKRFIEDSFGGTITLKAIRQQTVFSIRLPKK